MTITEFDLKVPKNTDHPISQVIAILTLTDESAITFQITDPKVTPEAKTTGAVAAPAPAPDNPVNSFTLIYTNPTVPVVIPREDVVVIEREGGTVANDPLRRTCRITFNLLTDYDFN